MALATLDTIYPVYVYETGMVLPNEGTYYVVDSNGFWIHKDTGILKAFLPVKNMSVLDELGELSGKLECNLPKIPENLVWKIKEFFRRVVEIHHAESEVTLYYNKEKEEFKIHVPKQTVSRSSVYYERVGLTHLEGMEDFLRVGTIHSHCDFEAFHSGTDHDDENDFDGIHVTFGNNDKDEFTISASIVVNGFRNKVDPEKFLEGISLVGENYKLNSQVNEEWAKDIDKWLEKVQSNKHHYMPLFRKYDKIINGDLVNWFYENCSLKNTIGDGPFEVSEVDGEMITIKSIMGFTKLSNKFFKKCN